MVLLKFNKIKIFIGSPDYQNNRKKWYDLLLFCGIMSDVFANKNVIEVDPEKMGGLPVFPGTRVPVKTMFDYLETGDSVERFLDHFPTVERSQAIAVLESFRKKGLAEYETSAR